MAIAEEKGDEWDPSYNPGLFPGRGQDYCMVPLPSLSNPQYIAAYKSHYHRTSPYNPKENNVYVMNKWNMYTHIYGASYITGKMTPAGPRDPLTGPLEW